MGRVIKKIDESEYDFLVIESNEDLTEWPEWVRTIIRDQKGTIYISTVGESEEKKFIEFLNKENIAYIMSEDGHIYVSTDDAIKIFADYDVAVSEAEKIFKEYDEIKNKSNIH